MMVPGDTYRFSRPTKLFAEPTDYPRMLAIVPRRTTVLLIGLSGRHAYVLSEGRMGWVTRSALYVYSRKAW